MLAANEVPEIYSTFEIFVFITSVRFALHPGDAQDHRRGRERPHHQVSSGRLPHRVHQLGAR